jgi:Cft2 family RNA processing exonuclease
LRLRNREPLGVDPATISYVILTHGHLDHCGYLPVLVKHGFRGKVLCSPPTKDVAEIILKDSARIKEEETGRANRRGYTRYKWAAPLYTLRDVKRLLPHFETHAANHQWIKITDELDIRFTSSGNILGSGFVEISGSFGCLVLPGDLGRSSPRILPPPEPIECTDVLVLESTYGDRIHASAPPADELAAVINETFTRGRRLADGEREIKFFGHWYHVRASVRQIGALSAHADQTEILNSLRGFRSNPRNIFLNHGEPSALRALAEKLRSTFGWQGVVPKLDAEYSLPEKSKRSVIV